MFDTREPSTETRHGHAGERSKRLAHLDNEALTAEVSQLAAHLAAGTARLLELIAEADSRELWGVWDARSLAEWTSWLTGLSPSVARDHAFVARKLDVLDETRSALSQGAISFDQAKAIARTDAPEHEAKLVEFAQQTTTGQLQRVVRAYRKTTANQELESANDVSERRYLSYFFDDESFVLKGRLPVEDGALVAKALDRARDRIMADRRKPDGLGDVGVPAESDPGYISYEQLRADALTLLAEDWLSVQPKGGRPGAYEVVVHVDADVLADGAPGGQCEIEGATSIPAETAQRLSCDGGIVGLLERGGEALTIGRKSRRAPHGMRRAVAARDKRCRFPGCGSCDRLQTHHVAHWGHHGETKLVNLLMLCRWHHRLFHEGGYTIECDEAGKSSFLRPDGEVVELRPPPAPSKAEDLVRANDSLAKDAGRTEITREPLAPWGAGEGVDVDYVTWAFFFQ
ncbi:MAG: DUF222 domain-containing protein [Actinomycetota bacterium]